MSKKRKAWATKLVPKNPPEFTPCNECELWYKGVVKDSNGRIERRLDCRVTCQYKRYDNVYLTGKIT